MKNIYVPKAFKTTIEVSTAYDPKGLLPAEILSGPANVVRVTYEELDKYKVLHEVLAARGVDITFADDAPTREEVLEYRAKYYGEKPCTSKE